MKRYTIWTFIFDLIVGSVTGGIWWVYRLIKVALSIGKN